MGGGAQFRDSQMSLLGSRMPYCNSGLEIKRTTEMWKQAEF